MFGYRHLDDIINLPRPDPSGLILTSKNKDRSAQNQHRVRRVVSTCLPTYVHGIANPKPDLGYVRMLEEGVRYRLGRRLPPVVDPTMFIRLSAYVRDLIKKEFDFRIDFDNELDFEEWLADTNYPEWRKKELREVRDGIMSLEDPKNFLVKVFGKDEHYVDFKHERGIYARDDCAKVIFGPLIKKFEKKVYSHPAFIKHVPVKDRPKYIEEMLARPGAVYVATDYTSFENHISAGIMETIEFQLYDYLIGNCGFQSYILNLFKRVVSGINQLVNRFFDAQIIAHRMSGEMTTSLGNGFVNYCLMRFCCHEQGIEPIAGVVEGDDALFSFLGAWPTAAAFRRMGCLIKLDYYYDISEAGFCGNIFDPDVLDIVTDPYKQLGNFGWTDRKYINASKKKKMALLRIKALSLIYQYPGCPIIAPFAKRVLFLTRSYDVRHVRLSDSYKQELLDRALKVTPLQTLLEKQIDLRSRDLMNRQYGIPISAQLTIESEIAKMELGAFKSETLMALAPNYALKFWDHYIIHTAATEFCFDYQREGLT